MNRPRGVAAFAARGELIAVRRQVPAWVMDPEPYRPELVLLMDPVTGRPSVKLSTSEKGSGLMLLGDTKTQGTWVILEAEGQANKVRLKNEDGPEQLLKP